MKINKKGFTLIELIVVIAIIGVLAMILVPSMMGYVRKSRRLSDLTTAREIRNDAGAVVASGGEGAAAFYSSAGQNCNVSVLYAEKSEDYSVDLVAKRESGYTDWIALDSECQDFVKDMNKLQEKQISLKYKPSDCTADLDCWYIAKRSDSNEKIEVWSGTSSAPLYRVWPETEDNY